MKLTLGVRVNCERKTPGTKGFCGTQTQTSPTVLILKLKEEITDNAHCRVFVNYAARRSLPTWLAA